MSTVPEEHCRALLAAGGARLVQTRCRLEEASQGDESAHYLVISSGKRLGWKNNYCVVTAEWLINTVCAFSLALPPRG